MRYCYCEAEVRSSSVSVVYIVCLRIVFSKAALQKRGSMEPIETLLPPPPDPPLHASQLYPSPNLLSSASGHYFMSREQEGNEHKA